MIDQGLQEQHIISQSQCRITSKFTGNLYFVGNNTCNTNFDHNNTFVISVCPERRKGFRVNVAKTENLLLIFKNIKFTATEKRNLRQDVRVTIYAGKVPYGFLFFDCCCALRWACLSVTFLFLSLARVHCLLNYLKHVKSALESICLVK